jgi:hydrogenase expression/formation protein HypE
MESRGTGNERSTLTERILLGHGSGGRLTRELVQEVFVRGLGDAAPQSLDDGAVLDWPAERLVFTTDCYVVSPLIFPGGDIGTLAISGTVNDLAVMGARPLYVSLGFIIEEGCERKLLEHVVASIAAAARAAGVRMACGDTKVVEKGKGDALFITASGIGVLEHPIDAASIRPGDAVLINGTIGDHGMAILTARKGFPLSTALQSDCAPLYSLIKSAAERVLVKWMRDPTRGGVATALNELVENRPWGVRLVEPSLPLHPAVAGLAEVLGIDPLYSANEGKVIMIVAAQDAAGALAALHAHPLGRRAAVIGEITGEYPGRVVLQTEVGTVRTLAMLSADPLPRIC